MSPVQISVFCLFLALCDASLLLSCQEWLAPLPDKSLPHLQIREGILKALQEVQCFTRSLSCVHYCMLIWCLQFPPIDRDVLKSSCIGKAVMLLFRHPKEIRQNKDRAGKLISKLNTEHPKGSHSCLTVLDVENCVCVSISNVMCDRHQLFVECSTFCVYRGFPTCCCSCLIASLPHSDSLISSPVGNCAIYSQRRIESATNKL